jgi:oxalate decarboxylase/phosphoglucose isomerase-like protein (cupin superfamily)
MAPMVELKSGAGLTPDQPRRIEQSEVAGVVEKLREIPDEKVVSGLNAQADVDPQAGIVIVHLTDIENVQTPKGAYHFHSALVKTSNPETPNFVKPHVHEVGQEPYRMVQGTGGEMNLGRVVNGEVVWEAPYAVRAGDEINVLEGQVHSLRNVGVEPLIFTFACPDSHLTDKTPENPEGDRVFTTDLPNGTPPQYPVKA